MRFLTKLAIVGASAASLALPATAAFASTSAPADHQPPGSYGNQDNGYGNQYNDHHGYQPIRRCYEETVWVSYVWEYGQLRRVVHDYPTYNSYPEHIRVCDPIVRYFPYPQY